MNPNDLQHIWFAFLMLSLIMYVSLDGFDLGVGILMLAEAETEQREAMLVTLSPLWDANETWLVLAGGILFGAFPSAYAAVGETLYWPIMLLLFMLMLRGVGFEFVHHAGNKSLWLTIFAWASLAAAVAQGVLLAALLSGLNFSGGFGWLCLITVPVVTFGYGLLGACYLALKTCGGRQQRAFRSARLCAWGWAPVALLSPFWLPVSSIVWQLVALSAILCGLFFYALHRRQERAAFFWPMLLLLLNACAFIYDMHPFLLPGVMTLQQVASSQPTLSFMLMAIGPLLPLILLYNGYQYFVFRGKSEDGAH